MHNFNSIKHLAIIMDGNARWAVENNLSKKEGYKKGLFKIKEIINICVEKKIKFLTLYALSSENIKRSNINIIFEIIKTEFDNFYNQIIEEKKARIRILGERKNLPKKVNDILNELEEKTKNNKIINLNIAFNYGFINELISSINKIIELNKKKSTKINEKIIRNNLYIPSLPDPDILIRTGGYKRLSNFMLFQLSYTELFFTKTLWPDFNKTEIDGIFNEYLNIERKYGL